MLDAQTLADRYAAAWNEPDARSRLRAIAALWAPSAPPRAGVNEPHGFSGLGRLILRSSRQTGGGDGVCFRAARSARQRGDVVTFRWEMVLAGSEAVLASGVEFLIVDDDGRILIDHPFAPA